MKCFAPMMIKNPEFSGSFSHNPNHETTDRMIPVRCGKCEGCLKSKINDWAFRLEQQGKVSLYVNFVTLTYSPKYVPLSNNMLPTLDKTDVQKFIKRLRKKYGKELKYFACGEYGSRTYRPHYHLIVFNVKDKLDIEKAWSLRGEAIGGCHIGDTIDNGAIPYTLKYMYKKGLVPAFKDDDRDKEFRIMSKKLGINYLTPKMIKWHLEDLKNRQYCVTKNGIKIALPRYFREILIEKSGKPRHLFREDESVHMSRDDNDYRTLESRVEQQKNLQNKFEKKQNQQERIKI